MSYGGVAIDNKITVSTLLFFDNYIVDIISSWEVDRNHNCIHTLLLIDIYLYKYIHIHASNFIGGVS